MILFLTFLSFRRLFFPFDIAKLSLYFPAWKYSRVFLSTSLRQWSDDATNGGTPCQFCRKGERSEQRKSQLCCVVSLCQKYCGDGDSQKNITFAQSKSEFNDNKMKPKIRNLAFWLRIAVKSYFWPLLCYDMRTRAIKNVFSVYKFPFPHQALKGLYAVCGPSM